MRAAPRQRRSTRSKPLVSAIIVTYETPSPMLEECLTSLSGSTYRPLELVVVDNSRTSGVRDTLETWSGSVQGFDGKVLYLPQTRNSGFAVATNLGVSVCSGELVLLLNPDAVVDRGALSALVDAAARRPQAMGFAPKVTLAAHPGIIDSVGIDLLLSAEGSQRGLGEPDIGQFDVEERIGGVCFAAALIRKAAFARSSVGTLDERFFMFYEDVDWSVRATLRGMHFWSVPSATVCHVHSASTRHMHNQFKARLIRRNLLWTASKNLERRRVVGVLLVQTVRTLRTGVVAGHPLVALRATAEALLGAPAMLAARRDNQRRRTRADREVLLKRGGPASFDTDRYRPRPTVASLRQVLRRLYVAAPSPELGDLILRLDLAAKTSALYPFQVVQLVRESGVRTPPGLEWLLHELEEV